MVTAELIKRAWFYRTWVVRCDAHPYVVTYSGRGLGSEGVSVDGPTVVRRVGLGRMSHAYRFLLGDRSAALSVAIPWWCELFPLCDLNFARLEVDGAVIYEEGRPPRRPLKCTSAVRGFPVVEGAAGDDPAGR